MSDITLKAQAVRLVIFDVDGVLTDRRLFLSAAGDELKAFNVHDGLGMRLLAEAGLTPAIITAKQSSIVTRRMADLGIKHVYQGQHDKRAAFTDLLQQLQLTPAEVAVVGDDLPDVPLICKAGLGIAVADAIDFVKQHADWVTTLQGGRGAVREVCEFILTAQQKLQPLYERYLLW